MDLENASANMLFKPIEHFSAAKLEYQRVTLENAFSCALGTPKNILLTLFDQTLVVSDLSQEDVQPSYGVELSFDLKFEIIYAEEKNVLSMKLGLRFFYDSLRTFSVYCDERTTIQVWTTTLAKRLNQRGFHEMFKPSRKLGKGNFATVYEVERITDHQRFAVKAFSKQSTFASRGGKQSLINELKIMRELSQQCHRNVLRLEGVYESDNSIYVMQNLLNGGQLFQKIQQNQGHFSKKEIMELMHGLLSGMRHMHSHRIMHRDLKPENIMLEDGDSLNPVIVDFGLATSVDVEKYLFFRCGTPGYVAPEIIEMNESRHIEPECDVFSAGVIFHILLMEKALFEGTRYQEVYRKNKEMQFDLFAPCYQSVEPNAIDLLRRMLVIDQKRRITAKDALNHPYFTGNNVVLTPSSVERIGSTEMVDEKAEVSSPNWTNVTETKPVQKRQTRVFAVHKGWENAVVE